MNNQKEFLQFIYNKFGDFKVSEEYVPNKYSKRYSVIDYLKNNKEPKCIHREIMPCGLVIESDESYEENKKLANQTIKVLKTNGFNFSVWYSGNKSIHIEIFFDSNLETELKTPEERTRAKHLFIKELDKGIPGLYERIDKDKLNERNMIRCAYTTHLKTNQTKEPEYYPLSFEENKMFPEIIEQVKTEFENKKKYSKIKISNINCPIIKFALENKLPEGNRNKILCKNASAILSIKELKKLAEIQEIPEQQIVGWKNKNIEYNIFEMINYSKELGLIHLFDEFLEKELEQ